ncbi:hypothetical protein CPB97_010224 [Podila verticillata]|nr:hypothetical protein CPB97_010224 [Podila verticillata]
MHMIKDVGKKTFEYSLSHEFAESAVHYRGGNTFPLALPIIENDHASVKFSVNKIKIQPSKTGKVKVQFSIPKTGKEEEFPFYSGWVAATPVKVKGGVAVCIPYASIKGDVAKLPIEDKDVQAPLLLVLRSVKSFELEAGHKIDFATETPVILSHLGAHTPDLTFRLLDAKTGAFVGHIQTNYGNLGGEFGRAKNLFDKGRLSVLQVRWVASKIYSTRIPMRILCPSISPLVTTRLSSWLSISSPKVPS